MNKNKKKGDDSDFMNCNSSWQFLYPKSGYSLDLITNNYKLHYSGILNLHYLHKLLIYQSYLELQTKTYINKTITQKQ